MAANDRNYDSILKLQEEGLSNFCRVCMSNKKNMKNVFGPELSRTVEELEFCTGILIEEDDGLPTMLCDTCIDNLSVAHKFKTACLLADDIFRKILGRKLLLKSIKKENEVLNENHCQIKLPEVNKQEALEIADDNDDLNNDNFNHKEEEMDQSTVGIVLSDVRTEDNRKTVRRSARAHAIKIETKPAEPKKNIEKKERNVCDICGTKFGRKPLLIKHKWEVHKWKSKINTKKDFAKEKNTELKSKKTLEEILDYKEDSFFCTICACSFRTEKMLDRHKSNTHGFECICEICGKQFTYRSSLSSHVKSHRPPQHGCTHCEYKAWHKSDLKKHIRIHTGEKSHPCTECASSFYNVSNLYEHARRTHGGRPRHACPRCGRAFHAAHHLRRHLDSHDNIKRHECEVCHAQFSRRCYWKKHLQKQHSITAPQIKPGRRKTNLVTGDYDVGKESIQTRPKPNFTMEK